MNRAILAIPVGTLAFTLAGIQWFNLREGGHAFTQTETELLVWSVTHVALMILAAFCTMLVSVMRDLKTRFFVGGFLAVLFVVQFVGAYVGRGAVTQSTDVRITAAQSQADAMIRQAQDIRSTVSPSVAGLSDSAASSGGKAARDRLDSARSELDRAAKLEREAHALKAASGVSATQIGGDFIGLFLITLSLCVEIGFALCAHFIARIYCNELSIIFNNLQRAQNRKTEASQPAKK